MICINKKCDRCKSHFTKQVIHKECYSDKDFMTSCDEYKKLEELRKTNSFHVCEGSYGEVKISECKI
ncbi:MAG: hypothetical protein HFJ52_00225 [Clostridia bacterium]|jgi:hypothetical protein|nr:hypothetical protein [Clostridia bacterium]